MGIRALLHRITAPKEGRASYTGSADISDPRWIPAFYPNSTTSSGKLVTSSNACDVSTVYACIKVLSETVASIPLHLYRRMGESRREQAINHELYYLLHDAPNPLQTSYEFIEMLMGHLLLRGNFYALKDFDGDGNITALYPLSPDRMVVSAEVSDRDALIRRIYEYQNVDGVTIDIPSDFVWHVMDWTEDGIMGKSRIAQVRQSIGMALALDEFGATFFRDNAVPPLALKYPGFLKEEQKKMLKETWEKAHAGSNKAWRTAVLENGLELEKISVTNVDAQFLESRNFQVEDICRIFRVPSILVQHPDKTSTYASAEQMMSAFLKHTILPWTTRLEGSISLNLLSKRDRNRYYAEFNMEGLLRGDPKTRSEAYKAALEHGWLSPNDVRAKENLDPIPNGDEYVRPANMVPLGTPAQPKGGGSNADTQTPGGGVQG